MNKTLALVLLLVATPVLAHPGHAGSPLQDGLLHPLTGLDHLLMLLGTGVLAALSGRNLVMPVITLALMFCGAVLGHVFGEGAGVEQMILLSLMVLSAGLLLPRRQVLLLVVMPLFALFHGWAHGAEAGPDGFWLFSAGFMLVSAVLLAAGFAAGCVLARHTALRTWCAGGVLAGAAMVLLG